MAERYIGESSFDQPDSAGNTANAPEANAAKRQELSVADHVRLLRDRAQHVDDIGNELRIKYLVPPEVLTPIHIHAVQLRERARKLEAGDLG